MLTAIGAGGTQHQFNVNFPASPTNPTPTSRLMIGSDYVGPVAGLANEFVFPTPENINIVSTLPDAFIRTGSGSDAIQVLYQPPECLTRHGGIPPTRLGVIRCSLKASADMGMSLWLHLLN